MLGFDRRKRRMFILLAGVGTVVLILNYFMLSGTDVRSKIDSITIPGLAKPKGKPTNSENAPGSTVRSPYSITTIIILIIANGTISYQKSQLRVRMTQIQTY